MFQQRFWFRKKEICLRVSDRNAFNTEKEKNGEGGRERQSFRRGERERERKRDLITKKQNTGK